MAETAKDTVYKPHQTPKSYTNYSGLELPEVDMRAETFLKPLLRMGVSGTPVHIKTTGIPLVDIHTTTALTTGTDYVVKVQIAQTVLNTSHKLVGIYSAITSAVKTGSWMHAIKGVIDYSGGGNASGGKASVINADLTLQPGAQIGGTYHLLDLWIAATAGFTYGNNDALPISYLNCGVWGTAKTEIDNHAFYLRMDGFVAGATNLISTDSQTVKCRIGANTRYMVMSRFANGLGLGTSGDAVVIDNSTLVVDVYTEHSALTGSVRTARFTQEQLVTDLSVNNFCLTAQINSSVTTGNQLSAIIGKVQFTAPGKADGGVAKCISAEMGLPAAAQTGGQYFCFDAEINAPASWVIGGNPTNQPAAFMKFGIWGDATAIASFDTNGYLFYIDGLGEGSNLMVDSDGGDPTATGGVRCLVGTTEIWLLYRDSAPA